MKPRDILLMLLVIILLGGGVGLILPLWNEQTRLVEELRAAQSEVERLKDELRQRDQQIQKLKQGDREVVESIARDKFGLAKEGEVIYQIPRVKETPKPGEK